VIALVLGAAVAASLDRQGAQPAALVSVYFLAGVTGGYGWHWLYRRDPVERLVVWALLLTLTTPLGFVPGADLDDSAGSLPFAWLGIFAGVILAECRQRRDDARHAL
jgi:hypothetical protein